MHNFLPSQLHNEMGYYIHYLWKGLQMSFLLVKVLLMQILTLHEISIVKLRISTPYSIPHYYSNMCPMNGQYFPFSIRALKETCQLYVKEDLWPSASEKDIQGQLFLHYSSYKTHSCEVFGKFYESRHLDEP